jgi:hypothetical protein
MPLLPSLLQRHRLPLPLLLLPLPLPLPHLARSTRSAVTTRPVSANSSSLSPHMPLIYAHALAVHLPCFARLSD